MLYSFLEAQTHGGYATCVVPQQLLRWTIDRGSVDLDSSNPSGLCLKPSFITMSVPARGGALFRPPAGGTLPGSLAQAGASVGLAAAAVTPVSGPTEGIRTQASPMTRMTGSSL